jgi:bifunctional non-homologous end joining protein LigD
MAGLKTYRAKRRFGVTKEPRGKTSRKRGHAYVIQKHDATRLHYDLRLELDGVMKSWAVTRGPSLIPGEKRLAVEVEDHPIEYNKFEGTIPEAEYGGGTVMIWDRGSWEPEADPHRGLEKGHLDFELHGEKLHGRWHLVRMHRRPGEKRNNWLLIKAKDEAARGERDKDILEEEGLSVASGRSMDEIAKGAPKKKKSKLKRNAIWHSNKPGRKKARALLSAAPKRVSDPKPAKAHGRHAPLPGFVPPALATLADKAPSSGNWVHEIKFDGYRIQARLDHGKVKLLTRKGLDWTEKFPTIAKAVAALPAKTALIDGEVTSDDTKGVSSFSLLQQDLKESRHDRMAYYVFDLLYLDGEDLRKLPLTERKEKLSRLVKRARGPLRFSESIEDSGPTLLKHACKLHLEGIISKLRDAPYRSGRGNEWLKAKCSDRQEFIVAGFAPSTADAHSVGALVLAFRERGKLVYAGRVGTGFTHQTARELYRKFAAIAQKDCPFATVPGEERGKWAPVWVKPTTVVEVDFRGWTHSDRVRQASFQGVREDKSAKDVVREKQHTVSAAATRADTRAKKRSAPVKAPKGKEIVEGVTLTHPDRVYWEDVGISKRDLAEFYVDIWKWMKPHVTGRVLALVRCPEGAAGQCFFQKHAHTGIPSEFLHLVPEDGDKVLSIDNVSGLIALVQGGVLEIHVRGSSIEKLTHADRLVFDLDPGPGVKWSDIVAAARDVRERLAGIKLKSFLKTTGGKGLHVVVPIRPTPWEEAKRFCRTVAVAMEADEPERYVSTATKAKRGGKIFLDYLRNSTEATAVCAYSTRARPGAPVSVPIEWSELGALKAANAYTVENLRTRLSRLRKDPWAEIGRVRQSLPKFK